ncbi:hypothetical protein C8R45DRAFT_1112494 [Mycena sanguinolenta]|nr:hypothetical protein C8R45DRAFT_1112494 [Mycena sanguinolenta]
MSELQFAPGLLLHFISVSILRGLSRLCSLKTPPLYRYRSLVKHAQNALTLSRLCLSLISFVGDPGQPDAILRTSACIPNQSTDHCHDVRYESILHPPSSLFQSTLCLHLNTTYLFTQMIAQHPLCIAFALSLLCGVSHAQQPSSAPSCTASCPPIDYLGSLLVLRDGRDHALRILGFLCLLVQFEHASSTRTGGTDASDSLLSLNSQVIPPLATLGAQVRRPYRALTGADTYKGEYNYTVLLRKRKSAARKPQTSEPRHLATDAQRLTGRKSSVAL